MLKYRSGQFEKKFDPFILKASIISLVIFVVLGLLSQNYNPVLAGIDESFNAFVSKNVAEPFISLSFFLSAVGDAEKLFGLAVLLGVIYLLHFKLRKALILIVSSSVAVTVIDFLKNFYAHPRPTDGIIYISNGSYPSGHAGVAAAFFVALMFVLLKDLHSKRDRMLAILCCTAAFILVGASRIILGVHWVSDVIGGWALGIFIATAIILLVHRMSEDKLSRK